MKKTLIGLLLATAGAVVLYVDWVVYGPTTSMMFPMLAVIGLWAVCCGVSYFLLNCKRFMRVLETLSKWYLDMDE